MTNTRFFVALVGVLFSLGLHAAPSDVNVPGIDLLKPAIFNKLSPDEQERVIITLRRAVVEIEATHTSGFELGLTAQPKQNLFLDIILAQAFAAEAKSCLSLGNVIQQAHSCDGTMQAPTTWTDARNQSHSCAAGSGVCAPFLFGPGVCAANITSCDSNKKSDAQIFRYFHSGNNITQANLYATSLQRACGQGPSGKTNANCSVLMARLQQVHDLNVSLRQQGSTAAPKPRFSIAPPLPPPLPDQSQAQTQGQTPPPPHLAGPDMNDPAMQTTNVTLNSQRVQPAAIPRKQDKVAPAGSQADYAAAMDRERQDFGKCSQWQLTTLLDQDSRSGSVKNLLLTFEQAQQIVCEHRPLDPEVLQDANNRLSQRLATVSVGGKCMTTKGQNGNDCLLWKQMQKNLSACVDEAAKRPEDKVWSKALAANPYIQVTGGGDADGNVPIWVKFRAGYQHVTTQAYGHPDAGTNMMINGKYLSGTLHAYGIGICDVYRDSAHGAKTTAPVAPARKAGRSTASVEEAPTWSVPSLPQGAPGANSRNTSGQGSN